MYKNISIGVFYKGINVFVLKWKARNKEISPLGYYFTDYTEAISIM